MLLKFRRRMLAWFRAADLQDDEDEIIVEEPRRGRSGKFARGNAINKAATRLQVDECLSRTRNTLNFTVFTANGGIAVEVKTYDGYKDENDTKIYVIPEDKELAEELAKIITLQAAMVR